MIRWRRERENDTAEAPDRNKTPSKNHIAAGTSCRSEDVPLHGPEKEKKKRRRPQSDFLSLLACGQETGHKVSSALQSHKNNKKSA